MTEPSGIVSRKRGGYLTSTRSNSLPPSASVARAPSKLLEPNVQLGDKKPRKRLSVSRGNVPKGSKEGADLPKNQRKIGGDFLEGGIEIAVVPQDRSDVEDESMAATTRHLSTLSEEEIRKLWPAPPACKAIFLDYDGTLREFEARPEMAIPTAEIEELLQAINARDDLAVFIISGRDPQFLETHLGQYNHFTLIAEHGTAVSKPVPSDDSRKWLRLEHFYSSRDHELWKGKMRKHLNSLVAKVPGSHMEEKNSALVFHFREAADPFKIEAAASRFVRDLEALKQEHGIKDVSITKGNKIIEVSHRNVSKGKVMRRLCEEQAMFHQPFAAVLLAGDDVADESMFASSPRSFISIKVGRSTTQAKFRVDSPQEFRTSLHKFLSLLSVIPPK